MKLTAIVTGVVATLGVVLAPSAAHAQAYVHVDAEADTLKVELDERTGLVETTPAPQRQLGDITRLVVRHAERRVKLSITYRAYKPFALATNVELRNNRGIRYSLITQGGASFMVSSRGEFLNCRVRSVYNSAASRYEISFPRWCVGYPTWLQAGAATYAATYDVDTGLPVEEFLDDAWLEGRLAKNLMATLGAPRLGRGATLAR
ncbi:hypothetical protein GCM10027425_14600 [Alteromonas gracilis]